MRRAAASLCHSGDVVRIVHYNVRRCIDLEGLCSRKRILQTLARLQPTLVTLNEVDIRKTPTLLDDLSAEVGLVHGHFFGHVRDVYGNVMASRLPLQLIEQTKLRGGSMVQIRNGTSHHIVRGMLSASIRVHGVDTRVAVTHLDHMSSAERRVQMNHVLQTLAESDDQQCLIMGDLNALGRADYTSEQWIHHECYNRAKGWSAPVDELAAGGTLHMLQENRFVDAFAAMGQRPHWQQPPWSAHTRDPERPSYRIDYAWTRAPSSNGGRRLVPLDAFVEFECGAASDHQPIVLDFEATSFDASE